VANALFSYRSYLAETFWPAGLAFFYPYNFHLPLVSVLSAALLLLIWSGIFLLRARQQPCLLMGWCWWLGTLVPTIGLVQFCTQAKDDRYMYIPSIGLFITLAWGLAELAQRSASARRFLPLFGGLALAACLAASSLQISYWQNSITLATHALKVTQNNSAAYESLGNALFQRGRIAEAMLCYRQTLQIDTNLPEPHFNLGVALMTEGKIDEAIENFAAAARVLPDHFELHHRLGTALLEAGSQRLPEAVRELSETVRLKPDFATGQADLGVALARQGKITNALPHFAEAVRLDPTNATFSFNLGLALLDAHQPARAAAQFTGQLQQTPDQARLHYRLAQALDQQGDFAGAVAHYRQALRLTPNFPGAQAELDPILAAHPALK
jgi:tetratricopeptide (TPR) repeat protein